MLCSYYFVEPDYTTKEATDLEKKLKSRALELVADRSITFDTLRATSFNEGPSKIKEWVHHVAENNKVNANHLMMVLRYVMTGTKVGAGVAETMHTLGKDTCLNRLSMFIETDIHK
ncbi:unnamed protein product [Absidia cylindrospora]